MLTTTEFADRVNRISLSPTLAVLMAAEQYRARGIDVADFGPGEPDFPTPPHIARAAIAAIEGNFTKYTPSAGILPLREAVCRWHAQQFGSNYTPPECVFTSGGKHALFNALNALIQSGDEVLLPAPYWVSYPDMIRYAGGRPVLVPTRAEDGFRLRAADVDKALGSRAKMLIVNSPNNPTGAVIPPGEYQSILEICRRRNVWLLADECYSHFLYGQAQPFSIAALSGAKQSVIVAGSLSKTFAMTGWRAGFALAPQPIAEAITRVQSQSTGNSCSITQKAALAALTGPMDSVAEMLGHYALRRERTLDGLRAIAGISCAAPEGAFYVFPNVSDNLGRGKMARDTATLARDLLESAHVAVVAGEAFGAPGYLRLSYATSLERIDEGLRRLGRYFAVSVAAS